MKPNSKTSDGGGAPLYVWSNKDAEDAVIAAFQLISKYWTEYLTEVREQDGEDAFVEDYDGGHPEAIIRDFALFITHASEPPVNDDCAERAAETKARLVERLRVEEAAELNAFAGGRKELQHLWGRVWNSAELHSEYEVEGFMAPYVVVTRKCDNVRGSLMFQHAPRYYFSFREHSDD